MAVRVKICGMMRSKDVYAALDGGADAVGFVVGSPSSPRNLSLNVAKKLMKSTPIFASKVAVTSSEDLKVIQRICSRLSPDALQLHRHNEELIHTVRQTYPEIELILATGIRNPSSIARAARTSRYSDAVLADTHGSNGMGGTGVTHDWELTATLRNRIYPHPLILAGGLTAGNVRLAVRRVRPYAVDVSSGVEEKLGVKDHKEIRKFIANAKEALT